MRLTREQADSICERGPVTPPGQTQEQAVAAAVLGFGDVCLTFLGADELLPDLVGRR